VVYWSESLQKFRVRFLVLKDFLKSNVSGIWSTQPPEDKWGATWMKSSGSGYETDISGRADLFRWPSDTPLPAKVGVSFSVGGGPSVGIVRLRTKSHRASFSPASTQALRPAKPNMRGASWGIFPALNRLKRESGHLPRPRMVGLHLHFPYAFMAY
jgi:hypothetical protein